MAGYILEQVDVTTLSSMEIADYLVDILAILSTALTTI